MDQLKAAAQKRQYEEYEPSVEYITEKECDTLLLFLPGFQKQQLRVQVATNRKLKISGQRQLENEKWSRFAKEFDIPENCDANGISAKLEGDILYIRQPKVITPAQEEQDKSGNPTTTTTEPPKTQKVVDDQLKNEGGRDRDRDQEHAPQEATSNDKDNGVTNTYDEPRAKREPRAKIDKRKEHVTETTNEPRKRISPDSANVKNVSPKAVMEVREKATSEKLSETAGSAAKTGGGGGGRDAYEDAKSKAGNYTNQIVSSLMMEMKKKREMFNLAVAVTLAMLIGFCVTNSIGGYWQSKKD